MPPTTFQPPLPSLSYKATPVLGSASADTSATVRFVQPESVALRLASCHRRLRLIAEHPDPVPSPPLLLPHTVSVQPRAELGSWVKVVPPTEVTYCEAAG